MAMTEQEAYELGKGAISLNAANKTRKQLETNLHDHLPVYTAFMQGIQENPLIETSEMVGEAFTYAENYVDQILEKMGVQKIPNAGERVEYDYDRAWGGYRGLAWCDKVQFDGHECYLDTRDQKAIVDKYLQMAQNPNMTFNGMKIRAVDQTLYADFAKVNNSYMVLEFSQEGKTISPILFNANQLDTSDRAVSAKMFSHGTLESIQKITQKRENQVQAMMDKITDNAWYLTDTVPENLESTVRIMMYNGESAKSIENFYPDLQECGKYLAHMQTQDQKAANNIVWELSCGQDRRAAQIYELLQDIGSDRSKESLWNATAQHYPSEDMEVYAEFVIDTAEKESEKMVTLETMREHANTDPLYPTEMPLLVNKEKLFQDVIKNGTIDDFALLMASEKKGVPSREDVKITSGNSRPLVTADESVKRYYKLSFSV